MRVFFDNAATTPLDGKVLASMMDCMQNLHGNPSSIHKEGRVARSVIEKARKKVAGYLNVSVGEIFFTSGGTESNNMALKCAVRDLGVNRIISSKTEHHAVLHAIERLKKTNGIEVDWVQQNERGQVDLDYLEKLLQKGEANTMVALMHANNEIGVLLNFERVSQLCQEYKALFHSDTVQTVGYYPIDLQQTPASFITGSAHKFHGPKGVGFIYINNNNLIDPFIDGGAQERNMRAGTENTCGIIGLATALEASYENLEDRRSHVVDLQKYLSSRLKESFPDISFNGLPLEKEGHYRILSVDFPPGPKTDLLLLNLDIAGISVSGGSACSSGADAGSHVIQAIKPDSKHQTVRFSLSYKNTRKEIDFTIDKLVEILS